MNDVVFLDSSTKQLGRFLLWTWEYWSIGGGAGVQWYFCGRPVYPGRFSPLWWFCHPKKVEEKDTKMKIYCIDCIYHFPGFEYNSHESCGAPQNVNKKVEYDTHFKHHSEIMMIGPAEINKNNDCKWFVKKNER